MQNTPKKNKAYKETFAARRPGASYWIILLTTVLLLTTLTVSLFVVLAMNIDGGNEPDTGDVGGNKPSGNKPSSTQKPSQTVATKTGISLPSPTPAGKYLAAASSVQTIDNISSQSAVLVDITNGALVAQKNADVKIYPASMTKVMTLLVACENAKDPGALLTVTPQMVEKYKLPQNEGASLAFEWKEGNQVTVEDALHMVIYESDTYACWLLADYVAGSEEAFVAMMNAKAKSLGLGSTSFANCTGMYNANHYTTCREMAAIMAAAMSNPAATAVITKTSLYSVDLYENGKKTENKVDMWSGWYTGRLETYRWGAAAPYYAGNGSDIKIVAGKTGYEDIPTSCFVTSGTDTETGRKYVCVQVGRINESQDSINSKTSTDDIRLIYQKYAVEG